MGNSIRQIDLHITPSGAAGSADGTVYSPEISGWLIGWHLDVPATLTNNGGTLDLWCGYPLMLYDQVLNVSAGSGHEKWYFPRIPGEYSLVDTIADTDAFALRRLDLSERYPIWNQIGLTIIDGSPVQYTASILYEEVPF